MGDRIRKHSTRLSQAHEAALDTPFKPGDRVQTIDGLPGRVLFVSASFSPGVTEYDVMLDSGMGQGTYTASQLRPIPTDYRGGTSPVPAGLLPAGVTGAFLTEDQAREAWRRSPEAQAGLSAEEVLRAQAGEIHVASDDYPEMGTILYDRPDPGQLSRVIGMRKTAASHSYGGQEDPREEDYNGGELNDSGTYWAEPGQQAWMHENEPQEEAPPPPWAAAMDSPVMARLAQIEEAGQFFGTFQAGTYHRATTINGKEIDDHGDAPGHGTVPRASEPDSYDDRSTEGDGDPKWSGQDDPNRHDHNGATVGMYPEGMSAGGGPGLEIGAFTAHRYGEVEGTGQVEQHMIAEHGVTPAQLSDLRLRSWHTYPQELMSAHTRASGGSAIDDWHGSTWMAHGRPMDASELSGHLSYHHRIHMPAGTAPGELAHVHNTQHEEHQFAGGEHHGLPVSYAGENEWTEEPSEHDVDEDTAATYRPLPYSAPPRTHDELMGHLAEHHGLAYSGGKDPAARFMIMTHDRVHNGPEGDAPVHQERWTPHQHEVPDGHYDPVFGSRHVPWTGCERTELHSWEGAPTASWGDFVNRTHFTNRTPPEESEPGAVEELQAEAANWSTPGGSEIGEDETASYQPFDSSHWIDSPGGHPEYSGRPVEMAPMDEEYSRWAQDADPNRHRSGEQGRFEHTLSRIMREAGLSDDEAAAWAEHMIHGHGWNEGNIERSQARGQDFAHMHSELHRLGLADHEHYSDEELAHEQHLTNMFGPEGTSNPPKYNPLKWGYDRAPRGGHTEGDQMERLIMSRPLPEQSSYEERFSPGKFRHLMNALDPPHEHDDDASSLDAGPSEGDEEFPGAHDDLDSTDAPIPPQAWPMAGTSTTEGGPAYTQGRDDGNRGRKFPPPPPPPMPAGIGDEDGAPGPGDPNSPDGQDGDGKKIQLEIKAHLDAFTAAVADPRFRFEFTAAWQDVIAKAKRIRREGRVRITHASAGMVIGAVSGDHDVYETGIQRPPHKPQTIQHWACGCPWASFHQDGSLGTRYAGRPCSHVMALQFEAQARTMFGREIHADPGIPNQELVVKSLPPWTPSGWAQHWLAPSAMLHRTAVYVRSPRDTRELHQHIRDHHALTGPGVDDASAQELLGLHDAEHYGEDRNESLRHQHDAREGLSGETEWPAMFRPGSNPRVDERGGMPFRGDPGKLGPFREHVPFRESSLRTAASDVGWYRREDRPRSMVEKNFEDTLRRQRTGRGWETELIPNRSFISSPAMPAGAVTHVMRGYLNGRQAGVIGAGASDNMEAWKVHNLHVLPEFRGQGVEPAMMDSFYDHVKNQGGRWIDHGRKSPGDHEMWQDYSEPHPEMNIHNSHPSAGWGRYFNSARVHGDMLANARNFPETSRAPSWQPGESYLDPRNRWTRARGLEVRPHRGEWPEEPVNGFQKSLGTPGEVAPRPGPWEPPLKTQWDSRKPRLTGPGESPEGYDRYQWGTTIGSRRNTPVGIRCHYKHGGPCEMSGPDKTAEALHHPRPSKFYSEIEENPDFNPAASFDSNRRATHVMNGYLGSQLAGQMHFSRSDDGKALSVENLHTFKGGQGNGVASAMMDDLYKYAADSRAWINHGRRTGEGNSWWANYREPFPELNVHHAHPHAGWMKYWSVPNIADEAEDNYQNSGGRGAHTQPPAYDPDSFPVRDRRERWTHALGLTPLQRATAVLAAAGEDPDEIIALAQLVTADLSPSEAMIWRHLDTAHAGSHELAREIANPWYYHDKLHTQRAAVNIPHSHDTPSAPEPGSWRLSEAALTVQADQANAPWGAQNVSQHPPGKPYGATQPPNKDQDPGSYGTLSGPDPENWGEIQDDSAYQMPLTNTGSVRPVPGDVHWPETNGWQAEDQESFPYSDRSATAGPSTSISPRDPDGIRMEEAIGVSPVCVLCGHPENDVLGDVRRETNGADYHAECWAHARSLDHRPECGADGMAYRDPARWIPHDGDLDPVFGAIRQAAGTAFPYHGTIPQLDGALAELRDEPEPALPSTTGDDDIEATAAADGTIGGGSAGSGTDEQAPADIAGLGEFGAAVEPSPVGQEPGMGSADEYLTPDDQSIQTIGQQQWSGGGSDSGEVAVEPGQPQGSMDDIVAAFQRSAAAKQFAGGGTGSHPAGGQLADGDIAAAAREFLTKTADVLPDKEAAELIAEGRGQRARNLGLLRLEGTHYEEEDEDLARRGVSLDDFDDDVISV